MLNPNEEDHQSLVAQVRQLVAAAEQPGARADFGALHEAVTDLSRRVFKREWDRVRQEL